MNNHSVLIIGSAPNAVIARTWPKDKFSHIVAINNAWRVRPDWDFLIYPDDFPEERHPSTKLDYQQLITSAEYVPIQNEYGGFVYAGGTMAFTAAYWALGHLKPKLIAFIGCDMIYPAGENTHFYGKGVADPLRNDVSLQSLEAKSIRFNYFALMQNCISVNLSDQNNSRLTYPKVNIDQIEGLRDRYHASSVKDAMKKMSLDKVNLVLNQESSLGYYFKSGKYWEHLSEISKESVHQIDLGWLNTAL